MKPIILLGWFFLTFWDGRVTKLDFQSHAACVEAKAAAGKVLRGIYISECIKD